MTHFLKIGEIGPGATTAAAVRAVLRKDAKAPAYFVMDSSGGDVAEAQAIAEVIASHRGATTVSVGRRCESAAIFPLVAAGRRVASGASRFLIHSAAVAFGATEPGRVIASDLHRMAGEVEAANSALVAWLSERCGIAAGWVEARIAKPRAFGAATALNAGLIHHAPGLESLSRANRLAADVQRMQANARRYQRRMQSGTAGHRAGFVPAEHLHRIVAGA